VGAPQVACVFTLLLLFRVLSTTAEDYFSPILTQMSKDFYLPPRLAGGENARLARSAPALGLVLVLVSNLQFVPEACSLGTDGQPCRAVTLMAWGNGAPDIFSSMAAVKSGEYELALGGQLGAPLGTTTLQQSTRPEESRTWLLQALMRARGCARRLEAAVTGRGRAPTVGAGMFIGTVVVGCVLRAGGGANMRGALVRDVSSYALAIAAVGLVVYSGQVLARSFQSATADAIPVPNDRPKCAQNDFAYDGSCA